MTPTRSFTVVLVALAMIAAACGSEAGPSSFEETFGQASTSDAEPTTAPTAEPAAPAPEDDSAPEPEPGNAPEPAPEDEPAPEEAAPPPPAVVPDALNLALTEIVELDRPIDMAVQAGNANIFVATKGGQVVEVNPDAGEIVQELINIADLIDDGFESGLLGIEFSPDGQTFFMHYSDVDHNNRVVSLAMDANQIVDGSGKELLFQEQPADNHNGGDLAFGPDGYLYVVLGDGGGGGDPFNSGQDTSTLLGSILRIDPFGGDPYAIPSDNPFVDGGGAEEIFIYGARNPWRISFDRVTGDLWMADVGQDEFEEVSVAYAADGGGLGADLGWNNMEGNALFAASAEPTNPNYLPPIYDYPRSAGCSVTGGYVYRGQNIPELAGNYVFGDYCTGQLWGLTTTPEDGLVAQFELGVRPPGDGLVSFGEGPNGELYILTFPANVFRLDPA